MRTIAVAVAVLLASLSLDANAQVVFTGSDDGSAVGGPNSNSSAAEASLLTSAATYGPVYTLDFESATTGFASSYSFPGLTISLTAPDFGPGFSGITNSTSGNLFGYDIDTGRGNWLGFPGSPDGTATFDFSNPTNAFGFYATGLQTVFTTDFTATFNGADGQTLSITPNVNGGAQYFGFTTANAFTSVTLSNFSNDAWGVDRVSYNLNAVSGVPEPATWAMMLLGFGFVGGAMRMKRRKYNASGSYA